MQDNFDIFFKQSKRDDILTIAVALFLALALHFGVYKLLPSTFVKKIEKPSQMAFEILPPEIRKKTPQFVEANPYGNELQPEKAAPISFKNQRVADEVPDKSSKSSRPFVKGEDKKYKKIVSGTSDELDKLAPARVSKILERPLTEHTRNEQQSQAKQSQGLQAKSSKQETQTQTKETSLQAQKQTTQSSATAKALRPDKIDSANIDNSSNAILVPKIKQQELPKTKNIENSQQQKLQQTKPQQQQIQQAQQQQIQDIPAPRARPRLSMKIPAGPLMDNNTASSNTGRISIDSRFSEFGAYQQRMIEAISRQWNLLGSRYDLSSAIGSQVVINFALNTEGELVSFKIVFSTSTHTGAGLCEQSILSTAPYGVWTQEMVNTLGQQPQQVTIRFLYR